MRGFFILTSFFFVTVAAAHYSGLWETLNKIARNSQEHELRSYKLLSENQQLKQKLRELEYKIQDLQTKSSFLEIKMNQENRSVASIPKIDSTKDLVSYDVYKWGEDRLLAIGVREFLSEDYEKSAQYLNELLNRYGNSKLIDDKVLYQAGIAAYKTAHHYDWAAKHLQRLVSEHPKSPYYRSAKLWLGLANLYQGDKEHFFETVEEFRVKYRNTDEWKILSRYYEEFAFRYQK
jgi:TolA-binding protein